MDKEIRKIGDFTFSKLSAEQAAFLKKKTKIIGYGGYRGGGKYYAVRTKIALMSIRYPGISICIISNNSEELLKYFVKPLKDVLGRFAEYDNRRKIFECENGSRICFRICQKDKTHSVDGCEFDVMFTINAEKYSTTDLIEFSYKVRGSESYPKRIYYIFNSFNEHLERIFLKQKYKKNENPADYSYISSTVIRGAAEEIPFNALEMYGT